MGACFTFTCGGCGFEALDLPLGPSPFPAQFDPMLVSCVRCKQLRSVDRRTTACRRHRIPYVVHDEDGEVPCPMCGTVMQREVVSLWD